MLTIHVSDFIIFVVTFCCFISLCVAPLQNSDQALPFLLQHIFPRDTCDAEPTLKCVTKCAPKWYLWIKVSLFKVYHHLGINYIGKEPVIVGKSCLKKTAVCFFGRSFNKDILSFQSLVSFNFLHFLIHVRAFYLHRVCDDNRIWEVRGLFGPMKQWRGLSLIQNMSLHNVIFE